MTETVTHCAWCGAKSASECKNSKSCHIGKESQGWGCMDHLDLLTVCGTFNPDECISYEDMKHLFNTKECTQSCTNCNLLKNEPKGEIKMSHYCWDVPKLSTNYTDWQNVSSVLTALPEHITNAIHVQVNLSGEEQLEVLSVYWDEQSGILHVDVAK